MRRQQSPAPAATAPGGEAAQALALGNGTADAQPAQDEPAAKQARTVSAPPAGLVLKQNKGNGDCLFFAVEDYTAVHCKTTVSAVRMRATAVKRMRDCKQEFAAFWDGRLERIDRLICFA